jgi:hypothetical protein
MPTRKQRRRRQKERRHEWEYVYVDDEGQEVEVDEPEARPEKPEPVTQTSKTSTKPKPGARGQPAGARAGRKIDPPSWRKVLRRAAIFAPIMLIIVYLLRPKNASALSVVVQVAVLLLVFVPFSYYVDALMYRSYRKRIGDPLPARGRKKD